jgi:hypothetical protein
MDNPYKTFYGKSNHIFGKVDCFITELDFSPVLWNGLAYREIAIKFTPNILIELCTPQEAFWVILLMHFFIVSYKLYPFI